MAEALNEQNNIVATEIKNIMNCLNNENVKRNLDKQLDVWGQIFSRLFKRDGMRMLCSHNVIRFIIKQRAHEALNYHNHPIIDIATEINSFIYQVEFMGLSPEDIHNEEQL